MVRRRIEIKAIEENSKRHTTFTKRRQGLMKKAEEFFAKAEAEGAVLAFSKSGNGYVFAHPHIDALVNRYHQYHPHQSSSSSAGINDTDVESPRVHGPDGVAPPPEERAGEAAESGGWNEAIQGLGLKELNELSVMMESLKRRVAEEIAAVENGGSSVGDSGRDGSS